MTIRIGKKYKYLAHLPHGAKRVKIKKTQVFFEINSFFRTTEHLQNTFFRLVWPLKHGSGYRG